MRKITLKKLLSLTLALCIMLSSFSIIASAQCAGHTDVNGDTLCDGCEVQLVAKVTEGETVTYYENIYDAIYRMDKRTFRVDLLADCVTKYQLACNGNITLYLNGYTISRSEDLNIDNTFIVLADSEFTIEAGDTTWEVEKVNGSVYARFFYCNNGGKLTINGGNFVGIKSYILNFLVNYGDVTLNNTKISGYFSSSTTAIENHNKLTLNNVVMDTGLTGLNLRDGGATATTINGGQFSAIYRDILSDENVQTATDNLLYSILGDGYFFYKTSTGEQITEATEKNGQVRILDATVTKAVADVNNTAFASFDSALSYAQTLDSATLKLYEDVTHSNPVTITGGNITFDLNGKTIAYTGTSSPSWDIQAGNHKVINGGTIKVGKYSYNIQVANGAQFKIAQANLPDGLGITGGGSVLGFLAHGSYFKGSKGWTNSDILQYVGSMAANEYLCIMPLQFTDLPAEYSVSADGQAIFNFEITDPTILYSRYDWYIDGELALEDGPSGVAISEFSAGTYRIHCFARSTQDESNSDALTFKSTVCVLNVLPCDTHIDNGDDSYCDLCNIQLAAKVTIGDVNSWYEDVKEAFAMANGNTATVKLLKNSSIGSSTIELTSGDINLDLNGYMIQSPEADLFMLKDSIKLTVNATDTYYQYGYNSNSRLFVLKGGTLEINGGEFAAVVGGAFVLSSIIANEGGTVTLNNLTLKGKTDWGLLYSYVGNAILNNCTFIADVGCMAVDYYGEMSTLTINGGYYNNIYANDNTGLTPFDLIGEGYYAADNDTKEKITECQDAFISNFYNYSYIENVLVVPENHTCQYIDGFCIFCNSYEPPEFLFNDYFWADGYHIYNLGQYNWFAENVTNGTIPNTSHAFIFDNIGTEEKPITKMIGSMENPFCGRIRGGDNTLTVNIISDAPAGIVSVAGNGAQIERITVNGIVESTGEYAGSVIGYVTDTIPMTTGVSVIYGTNNTNVKATNSAGGFIGGGVTLYTYLEQCVNYGTVTADVNCGGIVGYFSSTTYDNVAIDKCLNYGDVYCAGNGNAGAFIGKAVGAASIYHSGSLGDVYSASGFAGAFIGEGSGDASRPNIIVNSYSIGNISTETGAVGNIGPDSFAYGVGISNSYSTISDFYGVLTTSVDEAKSGALTYKLNDDPTYIVWKQTIGVHDHPVFEGKDVYGNVENNVYFNSFLSASIIKHQIRFDKNTDGTDAGTFDFRTIVKIDGIDMLCDDIEDICDISDGDGIVESGYLFNKNNYISMSDALVQINGGTKTYSQINNAYLSSSLIPGSYASACLISDIPSTETMSYVGMVYYLKYVQNGVPIVLMCEIDTVYQFYILYETYYDMAFPNA